MAAVLAYLFSGLAYRKSKPGETREQRLLSDQVSYEATLNIIAFNSLLISADIFLQQLNHPINSLHVEITNTICLSREILWNTRDSAPQLVTLLWLRPPHRVKCFAELERGPLHQESYGRERRLNSGKIGDNLWIRRGLALENAGME